MTDSFDFFTTNHNWNADRELSHSHTFPDIPQSRSDSADLHGHFQLCHTHSLILCERFCGCVEALFLPPLFIIMSWNLPLNKSTVFAGSFAGICREDSLSLSPLPSPSLSLPPSLSDKSKWNGSFHPSYLGQAMKYALLCKEMERNDLWPTKTSR